MISWEYFLNLVTDPEVLDRDIRSDEDQRRVVEAEPDETLFIVAGPGSGKTTALSLRVLKLIFVDDIPPSSIMATTFTRKAATELRSRILGWGDKLREVINETTNDDVLSKKIDQLDINQIITGTLDSIAEQVLADIREPGTQPPIPLETFVADAILRESGLFKNGRFRETDLLDYVTYLEGWTHSTPNLATTLKITRDVRDRVLHDQVDMDNFQYAESVERPGVEILCAAIRDYEERLHNDLVMDFAALEDEFLQRLHSGLLDRFVDDLRILLVDEYQDTNLLQEQIYFELANYVVTRDGSITVVGDDDQSLYRFRGATVELFIEFPLRLENQTGIQISEHVFLSNNYRSTPRIVDWCREYIELDSSYNDVRVSNKPDLELARQKSYENIPILGMFRADVNILAHDLAAFISDVFQNEGRVVEYTDQSFAVIKDEHNGAVGDAALIMSSPREFKSSGDPRLPLLLRQELNSLDPPIDVFNPRGQDLGNVRKVSELCGLILQCIDPGSVVQDSISNLPGNAVSSLRQWRRDARRFIATNPNGPSQPYRRTSNSLSAFVRGWETRTPQRGSGWPREFSLIDLMYELITWMPFFQEDPEGLVYLEVITRTITQMARLIAYDATIRRDSPHREASVKSIIWGIFVPLALGEVEVDEDLIEVFPRDRLNIMSIHQMKGLEFPLIIVDVGSDFRSNHWTQRFKRFPVEDDESGIRSRGPILENVLRPYSELIDAPARSRRDRDFDDLFRRYFVAFSRAQDVLLLVGLSDNNGNIRRIPNVATGWTRDDQWRLEELPDLIHI